MTSPLRPWQLVLATVALVGLSVVFASPFAWMASTSLKVNDAVQTEPTRLVPRAAFVRGDGSRWQRVRPLMVIGGRQQVELADGATRWVDSAAVVRRPYQAWDNYPGAVAAFPFARYAANTLVIAGLSVVGTTLSSSLVAYGLACVRWRGREVLFAIMLAPMTRPGQVTMIPLFLTFRRLGWVDTILPLVVPTFLGNAAFVFLLRQFYRTIPGELLEAARLDGAGDLRIWARVVVLLSRPTLPIVSLFTFIAAWNDSLGPLTNLLDARKYTLSTGLTMFQGQYGSDWGQMMAASVLMTVPVLALFFLTQKSFVQGVKLGGVKG